MLYRIVIKGAYGLTNFGDDALMYVLALQLKHHFDVNDIVFVCKENKYNQYFSNGFKIETTQNFKSIETKLLLFGGGTQFYSFLPKKTIPEKLVAIIRAIFKNPKETLNKYIFKSNKRGFKNIGAIGIGVGPFLEKANSSIEKNAKSLFSQMSHISVRDTYTANKMIEWKINKAQVYTDICFLMNNVNYKPNNANRIKKIGIIVRDWDLTADGKAYYDKIELLIKEFKVQNIEATLIIFAKSADKFWNKKKHNFPKVLEWDPNSDNIESFMDKLSDFDLMITARYHGAIFSSLLNIPFISIVVEQKLALISDIYSSGSKKWEYPFNVNDCLDKVNQINSDYKNYVDNICLETSIQKEKATNMFSEFIKYCEANNI